MSGYGPIRAPGLGLPSPRSELSGEPTASPVAASTTSDAAPAGGTRRPEAASELTQASGVLLDDPFDPYGPATGPLDARSMVADGLIGGPVPVGPPPSVDARHGDRHGDRHEEGRHGDRHHGGLHDEDLHSISRSSGIWLWLWGPLLAAVLVVGFLAGLASAPVVLPLPTQARPATVVDDNGRTISTVEPPTPSEQLPSDQLPDLLLGAVVAVQDPGYLARESLSAADLFEAGAADVVRVRRHGDTIEERYARQVRVTTGSVVPSLRETSVAVRLSQRLSRRALLARYVNGMYFGNGVYGVGAASRYYFGRPLTALDPGQIALLVGIGDDPAHHNPVSAPATAEQARLHTLDAMRAARLLTPEQAEAAARQAPDARPHVQVDPPSAAPDFAALIESSLLARYGEDAVYGQDLQVVTPLDLDLQSALDDSVRRLVGLPGPTVLAVATDPRTGDVRALTNRGSAAPGSPEAGADGVLFARRPLGTLGGQVPTTIGDGNSASVGEVAAAFGAVAGGGSRHDLRSLTRVTRPRSVNRAGSVLDSADPLPAGQVMVAPEQATALTAAFRSAGRRAAPEVPFALAGATGAAGADAWFVGCVPDLCLTLWIGGAATPSLAAQVVAATFTGYLASAPGRISVPALPVPRTEERRSGDDGPPHSAVVPSARPTATPPPRPATTPSPRARATAPPSTPPSPAASPTATGAPDPSPQPTPPTDAAPAPDAEDDQPQPVADGLPQTEG